MWVYQPDDVLYLDEKIREKFTSDFRDVVTVLPEGWTNVERKFQKLKYPVDVLDMLYAYTKEEHYLDIRNQIVKRGVSGEEINMGSFYDEMDRKRTIETARAIFDETKDERMALYAIKCGLKVTMEEAQKVFDTEVAEAVLV